MITHTPGPWVFNTKIPVSAFHAPCFDFGSPHAVHIGDTGIANARLIAASPDLLSALQALMDYEDDVPATDTYGAEVYAKARAAIAKATS